MAGADSLTRFTPAYAGNTDDGFKWEKARKVHPRIRGEYGVLVMI